MQLWQYAVIAVAGMLAGTINAVVGSGTLITFPVLLAFHYPPVMANVSNGLGSGAGLGRRGPTATGVSWTDSVLG